MRAPAPARLCLAIILLAIAACDLASSVPNACRLSPTGSCVVDGSLCPCGTCVGGLCLAGQFTNVAVNRTATQSVSTGVTISPAFAVNGNRNLSQYSSTTGVAPWWEVDLGKATTISTVIIWNRLGAAQTQLDGIGIKFLTSARAQVYTWVQLAVISNQPSYAINLPDAPVAQIVQIYYPDSSLHTLTLVEVEVYATVSGTSDLLPCPGGTCYDGKCLPGSLVNVALGKAATQSDLLVEPPFTYAASLAVDGNRNGVVEGSSRSSTKGGKNSWWQVNLGAPTSIFAVVVWNQLNVNRSRIGGLTVRFAGADGYPLLDAVPFVYIPARSTYTVALSTPIVAQIVRIYPPANMDRYITLAEVEVYSPRGSFLEGTNTSCGFCFDSVCTAGNFSNVAVKAPARQSSNLTGTRYPATAAVDGNRDGSWFTTSVSATSTMSNPWWLVNITTRGAGVSVSAVLVWPVADANRTKLNGAVVQLLAADGVSLLGSSTPITISAVTGSFAYVASPPVRANIVKILFTDGLKHVVQLGEVEVFTSNVASSYSGCDDDGTLCSKGTCLSGVCRDGLFVNVAIGKRAIQSGNLNANMYLAGAANDGNRSATLAGGSVAHTLDAISPWWQVDLGAPTLLSHVLLWNRLDQFASRLAGAVVVFIADDGSTVQKSLPLFVIESTPNYVITAPATALVRTVQVTVPSVYDRVFLALAEVEIYAPLCNVNSKPGSCSCLVGWRSPPSCTEAICSQSCNNGTCTTPGKCTCNPGWNSTATTACVTAICKAGCKNGACAGQPGTCSCKAGWSGELCDQPICLSGCLRGGCTMPGTCVCQAGWKGTKCDQAICPTSCLHGACALPYNCSCNAGWQNANCSSAICTETCVNGACTVPGNCTCSAGWNDPACSTPICTKACVQGNCTAPNTCTCNPGWSGPLCDAAICSKCVNGACVSPQNCDCKVGWSGDSCEEAICLVGCEHGDCPMKPGICSCQSGWTGTLCNRPVCSPACASSGSCNSPNKCTCQSGWLGVSCETPVCNIDCVHGACTSPDECTCILGWQGASCDFGVCSSGCVHGACMGPNNCTCDSGFTGSNCNTTVQPKPNQTADPSAILQEEEAGGLSTGAIAGIAAGGALVLLVLLIIVVLVVRNYKVYKDRSGGTPAHKKLGPAKTMRSGTNLRGMLRGSSTPNVLSHSPSNSRNPVYLDSDSAVSRRSITMSAEARVSLDGSEQGFHNPVFDGGS